MSETCRFVTVLDRPCGRPATWWFMTHRVFEPQTPAEPLCTLHHEIAALEAAFGCERNVIHFDSRPIPEGSS